ncbi:DNA-binding transcriptional regulator, LysR family [Amycolatopsis arida]|uniref:DNA-binding transcriptional regulator, LysR family n=1 Tax=Amycolatopsis arida TaxID=587909 RepID=A0A1I5YBU6_9PSEU|nr:LysR family transcriptional regulator [Amycolatopsis arida]TDX90413.1 DNA-binding transcriptional LysR family regulator [Amycolatopsis arida]SFQ41705.1 DNA-binding transcriptional regulator, LysR family [Amycolatopsis arida]
MLEVRRLRLLRELARHGTIAATARACSLTPSAVSQQLALLEREVGAPLLIRDGRRLVLTEAATLLVGHAEAVLAELERARASVAELTSAVRGVLRVAAFPTAARALLPTAIARCRRDHPDLRVHLVEADPPEAVAQVASGALDLALVYEYDLLPRVRDTGIETTVLLREPLLAAIPEGWCPEEGPIELAELAERPWIAPHGDAALRATLDRACGIAGFVPGVDYASSDYTAILALVAAGLGVSLMPALAGEPAPDGVRLREVVGPRLVRTVSAVVRAGGAGNPPVAAMVERLRVTVAGVSSAGRHA